MNDLAQTSTDATHRDRGEAKPGTHRGPSLIAVAAIYTALFVASLVLGAALSGGGHFPSPFDPDPSALSYFTEHRQAVQMSAFLQFCSSIPFGIFAATAVSRLRFLGVNVAGPSIALFGGFAASIALALSAMTQWVLSQPGVTSSESTVRALQLFAFATGGPGFVVTCGLLIAGISVSAGLHRHLPRWVMWFGLVLAVIAELSTLTFISPRLALLLPAVRFPSFVWMIATGALLAKSRRRHVTIA